MGNSETFGVQKGHGEEIINWLNEQSKTQKGKLEARLYGYTVTTKNFGEFEMFSWIGDVQIARKLIIKASKKFKIRIIEGGYKPKEKVFKMKKFDYAKVKKGKGRGKKAGGGMTAKGVAKYRRDNPGSKLKTAVTTPPSKLKKGSKAYKRRKAFCARSRSWTSERGKAARRKWNC